MRLSATLIVAALAFPLAATAQYYGRYTTNPIMPPAPPAPSGTFNNPYGNSANSPGLYDNGGRFHGNLNANPYDPNSVANRYGSYGSQYSPDSVNNPYGRGLGVYGPNSRGEGEGEGEGDDD